MDTLKKEIAILIQCSDFKEIEKQLQTINKLIVTNYMFELSNGLRIYPIEVEAYFKHPKFNDGFVHGNELQKIIWKILCSSYRHDEEFKN